MTSAIRLFGSLCMLCLVSVLGFAQLRPLRVSENQRFLTTTDGQPFFWLADTGWELFHRLKKDEAERYLKRRAEQGFTVIQAVVLAEMDGLHTPNTNGRVPFWNDDPTKPNEEYFRHVDEVIDLAAKYNLYIGLLPTWGDKVFKDRWGTGPEVFDVNNAKTYGRWLGERYKNKSNLIWVLGGDRNPRDGSQDVAIWRAMAAGVVEGVGGNAAALLTYHPQPSATCSSSPWFHQDEWLDFNMLQTGHCRDTPVWKLIAGDYARTPLKPVINGEPIYEEHPVCFNWKDLGHSNAYDVRKAAYLSVFAGSCGHTYGCHAMWQFYDRFRDPVNMPMRPWHESLDLTGANQMKFLRALIESRPVLDRVPDQSLVSNEGPSDAERIQATRGKDYAFVYTAYGKPVVLNMGKISGVKVNAAWYSPRNGEVKSAGSFDNKGTQSFTAPSAGQGQDWVLILDDASKNYSYPTTK
jgi:hypothetical protein